MQVRSGSLTGWLQLSRLSLDAGGSAGGIAALNTGRTGTNNIVSASGGRSLDAEDFARATPNPAAVSALSRTMAGEAAARQFAQSGGLKERNISYLREPGAAGASGGSR